MKKISLVIVAAICFLAALDSSFARPHGGTASASVALTINQDWINRSTAAGVTAAYHGTQLSPYYTPSSSDGYNGLHVDTTINLTSGGTVRLDIPQGRSDPTMWGNLGAVGMMNGSWGNHSDLYVQFRYRITASMRSNLGNNWSSNWKIWNIYQGSVPCQQMDITGVHPQFDQTTYIDCGNGLWTSTTSANSASGTPYLSQQDWALPGGTTREAHGVQSAYPNVNWDLPTDSWMAFYIHVHIDVLGGTGNKSSVEVWVQTYQTPYVFKITSWLGNLPFTNSSSDVFNTFLFDSYMTGNTGGAAEAASVWIDELLFSNQPIAPIQTWPASP